MMVVRPIKRAFVYGRNEQRRESFASQMSEQLHLEVVPVDRPQEAVEDLPIVVTATGSREPVFDGAWLAEGALVCAVGSNWLYKAEIDATVVRRADNIVCDSVEACRNEAGDFVASLEKGIFDWSRAVNLCDVVSGRGRMHRRDRITLFKSVGMADRGFGRRPRWSGRRLKNKGWVFRCRYDVSVLNRRNAAGFPFRWPGTSAMLLWRLRRESVLAGPEAGIEQPKGTAPMHWKHQIFAKKSLENLADEMAGEHRLRRRAGASFADRHRRRGDYRGRHLCDDRARGG